jgi:hypothetical protein
MSMPTLEQIVEYAQALSMADQRLLAELIEPPRPIEEIAAEQGVGPFDFKAVWEGPTFWPEDETVDEFIDWWREGRSEQDERTISE